MQKQVRTLVATIALGIGMAGLAGCGTDPVATTPLTLRIAAAESKWKSAGLQEYSFNSTIGCFCLDEYGGPMRVTVRQGVVTSVVSIPTGTVRSVSFRTPIDSVFALIRREALENPSRLAVSFDATIGYPRRVEYGNRELDGGATIWIDSLRATP